MPALTLTKNYEDATLLLEDDFNVFLDELEALLNTTKLDGTNILDSGITASLKILGNTTTAAKLQSNSVTTAKLADEGVDTTQINTDAITTAKFADSSVTTAKIAASAVTNAKFAAANVTTPKFSYTTDINATNVSDTSGTVFGATTYYAIISAGVEKTLGSSSIVSSGRPILVALTAKQPDATYTFTDVAVGSTTANVVYGAPSTIECQGVNDVATSVGCIITINRNGTPIYSTLCNSHCNLQGASSNQAQFPSSMMFIDQPAAGSYTYTCSIEVSATTFNATIYNTQLNVLEL